MAEIAREDGRRLFGADPAGYDAARPGHAHRVYEVLGERCGVGPGTHVLEIGPGTGQATRRLLELGAQVVAIEPDPALAAHLPTVTARPVIVRNESLEEADLPGRAFAAAAAASSFHWVDEAVGLGRIFSALEPGGWVALWWTLFGSQEGPDPFQQAVGAAIDRVCADAGVELERSPSGGFQGAPRFGLDADARRASLVQAGFEDVRHELIPWTHTWDSAGMRALYGSFSPVLRLEPETRAAVLEAVTAVAEQFGGRIELQLRTSLFTAQRPAG